LTESTPEHIVTNNAEQSLCEVDCTNEDARVVPGDRSPVADASVHLCADCADEWARIEDETMREPTVRCACDRIEDGHAWTCGEVVPESVARALRHPDADDEMMPVCPDCYKWIRNLPSSGVETPVDEAPTWASHKCRPE
jgi:hypothetical protein